MPTQAAGGSGGVPDATVETGPPLTAEQERQRAADDAAWAAEVVDRLQTKVDKAQQALTDAKQALTDAKGAARAAAKRVKDLDGSGD